MRFSETDAMGVANNSAYLAWFEVGRIEYLRELGHSYAEVHSGPGGGRDGMAIDAVRRQVDPAAGEPARPLHAA